MSIPGVTGVKAPGRAVLHRRDHGGREPRARQRRRLRRDPRGAAPQPRGLRPQHGRLAAHRPGAARPTSAARSTPTTSSTACSSTRSYAACYDTDADGRVGSRRAAAAACAGKADFIGVNYYSPAYATGLARARQHARAAVRLRPDDRLPRHRQPQRPALPAPLHRLRLGDRPEGLRNVLNLAASYGRPIYVTENGIDDADDSERPEYLVQPPARRARGHRRRGQGARLLPLVAGRQLRVVGGVSTPASGCTRSTRARSARRARPSARLYARIAAKNALP